MQEYYEPEYVSVFYSESLSRFNFKPDIFEQCILISAEKVQERKKHPIHVWPGAEAQDVHKIIEDVQRPH